MTCIMYNVKSRTKKREHRESHPRSKERSTGSRFWASAHPLSTFGRDGLQLT
jgi:hypothetical protein